MVAAGFRTLKLKVGGVALADDVARVAAVSERMAAETARSEHRSRHPSSASGALDARADDTVATGADDAVSVRTESGGATPAVLRLDANGAWTRDEAERALAGFAPFRPVYVEEPLATGGAAALAVLARASTVPLAIDESLRNEDDLAAVVAAGTRVHVVLKAVRAGGPTRLVALARRALAAGLPVTVTDAIESGVGMGHALHAAAALLANGAPSDRTDEGGATLVGAVGLGGAQLAPSEAAFCRPFLAAVGPGIAVDAGGCAEVSPRGARG